MGNLLNVAPDYQITRTPKGVRRRYLFENGQLFSEWTSDAIWNGIPLVQIANGRSPETGKLVTARGVIAIGQRARGIVAIGQIATGIIAIGQAAVGVIAIGQVATGVLFGLGQIATGVVAIGQVVAGVFGFAMQGLGPSTLHVGKAWHP